MKPGATDYFVAEFAYGWCVVSTNGQRWQARPTKEEAEAMLAEHVTAQPTCRECGAPVVTRNDSRAADMLSEGHCSTCWFWTRRLAEFGPRFAVVAGCLYSIGEDELAMARRCRWPVENGRLRGDYRHVLGHAGAECIIRFNDGRTVTTTNLWAHGEVPEWFRERLPDNATFQRVEPGRYVGAGAAREVSQ